MMLLICPILSEKHCNVFNFKGFCTMEIVFQEQRGEEMSSKSALIYRDLDWMINKSLKTISSPVFK
jgi:hypothetical protein